MHASISTVQASLRNIEEHLRCLQLLRDHNDSTVLRVDSKIKRVTWRTATSGLELSKFVDSTIEEYLCFLAGRHFNFMLVDGSLVQLSYDIRRLDEVVGGRCVWYPCPVAFTTEELEYATIDELVLTTPHVNLACRAPLRVDYAPNMATADHPGTHMHSGVEKFRLPTQRAIEPSRFVRLILRTAYPDSWRGLGEQLPCDDWAAQDSLSAEDRQVGFLGWQPSQPT